MEGMNRDIRSFELKLARPRLRSGRGATLAGLALAFALGVGQLSSAAASPAAQDAPPAGPEQAKAIFDNICSKCHGPNGEGTAKGPQLIGDGAEIRGSTK